MGCVLPELQFPSSYMSSKNSINYDMYIILLNWLADVRRQLSYSLSDLLLGVQLLRRWLVATATGPKQRQCTRQTLQLWGMVAMWVANKANDDVGEPALTWTQMCDNAFTVKQVIAAECQCLKALRFVVDPRGAQHLAATLSSETTLHLLQGRGEVDLMAGPA